MAEATVKQFHCPSHWTLAVRIAHYTDKSGGPDACWPWTGVRDRDGYGTIWWKGAPKRVSRIVCEEAHGPIPPDLVARHRCDWPPCANPSHLRPGTPAENTADMMDKGRQVPPRGTKHGLAKLSEIDVRAIREAAGLHREIAAQYGISQSTVTRIKGRKKWGWLE